jgi:signal transduction histidine kinase
VSARARIFEPYQRAHQTTGLQESIGLGLAVSRQLAHLMSGDLTCRHEQGHSVFELSLPLAEHVVLVASDPSVASVG